ncbi:lipoprotein-releasing ABC transporter ATP-binding protein LolD [Agitococcus lubricus]|uniref:Lipoprotein-releasing system ATP-binding protein LolD n=1 Tax=Agitococcus lubricus TaxID=1077255 RepID=A0A2T5J1P6_9GAMM|nr:lipoprotein-releasing ABC transporter ATP-binding protein LolD [Agitococcus lubricus]PTQ90371.1 lipoprotein-releasing system ATP-binding protein [Agitococcus lubricus]
MNDVVLRAEQLAKTFNEGLQAVDVLKKVDFSIKRGEFVAIVGSSGSGKSTLLHLLGGLETPSSGQVTLLGHVLSQANDVKRGQLRNQYLGFVYQFHHLLPEFTALENVCMPLLLRDTSVKEAEHAATALLVRVGLGHRLAHKPAELSGGERQRVALARALVTKPALVLADEPTGNLDQQTAEEIQQLLQELKQELGMSLVIVTHDLQLAQAADRVLTMKSGVLIQEEPC